MSFGCALDFFLLTVLDVQMSRGNGPSNAPHSRQRAVNAEVPRTQVRDIDEVSDREECSKRLAHCCCFL